MKPSLSTPALTLILVILAGIVFPLVFSLFDRLLRSLLVDFNPLLLTSLSFAWLLLFYYLGIKFSLEYITREFELSNTDRLFRYSNILFALVTAGFYATLISSSPLSNLVWGCFFLATMGIFYRLSSDKLSLTAKECP